MRFNSHRAYHFSIPAGSPRRARNSLRRLMRPRRLEISRRCGSDVIVGANGLGRAHLANPDARLYSVMTEDLCDDEREFFEERAAIGEYDGCRPRPIAEAEATRALEHRRWQLGKIRINRWPDPEREASTDEPCNALRPGS